ncbi:MAG: hypothetical protein KME63_15940 [Candidatus Thiodiazotropha sp. (ex Clathrolucina costata)]|nr:hypothetical protein [Candidatus Thiodiazotropha taylori]MCG7863606.1 hypothetical protein [Candidatus Thiodiazotropha endolucinida]
MEDSSIGNTTHKAFMIWIAVILILIIIYTINYFSLPDTPPEHVEKLQILTQLFIGVGVLFAGLTYYNSIERQKTEDNKNQSRILLEYARSGFEQVIELLSNHNNDRVVWIRAARILAQTISLKKDIKTTEHMKAYEIEEFKCKGDLYRILSLYDKTGSYDPLPPQFFYGIPDWEQTGSLDEAAIKADTEMRVGSLSIDDVVPEPSLYEISIPSIVTIYDFMEYKEDFIDPLNTDIRNYNWGDAWINSMGKKQGAMRYVYHRTNHYVFGGKIYQRKTENDDS